VVDGPGGVERPSIRPSPRQLPRTIRRAPPDRHDSHPTATTKERPPVRDHRRPSAPRPAAVPLRPSRRTRTRTPASPAAPAAGHADRADGGHGGGHDGGGGAVLLDWLTVSEVTAALRVPRATFYRWRQQRVGPPAVRLPNGQLRIHRRDLSAWLTAHRDPAPEDTGRAAPRPDGVHPDARSGRSDPTGGDSGAPDAACRRVA
jgi:excisionase family DNA binding protein